MSNKPSAEQAPAQQAAATTGTVEPAWNTPAGARAEQAPAGQPEVVGDLQNCEYCGGFGNQHSRVCIVLELSRAKAECDELRSQLEQLRAVIDDDGSLVGSGAQTYIDFARDGAHALNEINKMAAQLSTTLEMLEQATASYREKEPCGHTKNFLIGDEHGHFTCTLCRLGTTREQLVNVQRCYDDAEAELEAHATDRVNQRKEVADTREIADNLQKECDAHREALQRFLSAVSPTGFDDMKAEEAFETALKCVIADREVREIARELAAALLKYHGEGGGEYCNYCILLAKARAAGLLDAQRPATIEPPQPE